MASPPQTAAVSSAEHGRALLTAIPEFVGGRRGAVAAVAVMQEGLSRELSAAMDRSVKEIQDLAALLPRTYGTPLSCLSLPFLFPLAPIESVGAA